MGDYGRQGIVERDMLQMPVHEPPLGEREPVLAGEIAGINAREQAIAQLLSELQQVRP